MPGPTITIDGVKMELKCPKCGSGRVQMSGGTWTSQGITGCTITCMDCGHVEAPSK